MSESTSGLSDEVVAEVTAQDKLEKLVEATKAPEPEVEPEVAEELPQRIVVPTEHAWTVQSQHGVLLDHFVPTQDYQNDPGPQVEFSGEDNW